MLEFYLDRIIKKGSLKSFSVAATDRYYDHTTFKIESLSDYIQLVETLSFSFSKNPGGDLLYRGMADSQWWLLPSILRNSGKNRKTYALEHDLAVSFLSEMPDLFSNTNQNATLWNPYAPIRLYAEPIGSVVFCLCRTSLKAGARCLYPKLVEPF